MQVKKEKSSICKIDFFLKRFFFLGQKALNHDASGASPSSKPSKSKSKKSLNPTPTTQAVSSSTSAATTLSTNASQIVNKTPSLMSFISKLSNKKVTVNKVDNPSTDDTSVIIIENNEISKSPKPPVKPASLASTNIPQTITNLVSSTNLKAPLSPKMTPNSNMNTNIIAEKRGNLRGTFYFI